MSSAYGTGELGELSIRWFESRRFCICWKWQLLRAKKIGSPRTGIFKLVAAMRRTDQSGFLASASLNSRVKTQKLETHMGEKRQAAKGSKRGAKDPANSLRLKSTPRLVRAQRDVNYFFFRYSDLPLSKFQSVVLGKAERKKKTAESAFAGSAAIVPQDGSNQSRFTSGIPAGW
jgi:hypothetical protein